MARLCVGTYVSAEAPKEPKVRKSVKNKLVM
jgi:hypothetical protein